LIIMFPSFLIIESIIVVYSLSNGFFGAKLKASLEVVKNLPMLANERKKIQKSRKIDDKKIFELMSLTIHHPYLGKHSKKLNTILSFFAKIYKSLL